MRHTFYGIFLSFAYALNRKNSANSTESLFIYQNVWADLSFANFATWNVQRRKIWTAISRLVIEVNCHFGVTSVMPNFSGTLLWKNIWSWNTKTIGPVRPTSVTGSSRNVNSDHTGFHSSSSHYKVTNLVQNSAIQRTVTLTLYVRKEWQN